MAGGNAGAPSSGPPRDGAGDRGTSNGSAVPRDTGVDAAARTVTGYIGEEASHYRPEKENP